MQPFSFLSFSFNSPSTSLAPNTNTYIHISIYINPSYTFPLLYYSFVPSSFCLKIEKVVNLSYLFMLIFVIVSLLLFLFFSRVGKYLYPLYFLLFNTFLIAYFSFSYKFFFCNLYNSIEIYFLFCL